MLLAKLSSRWSHARGGRQEAVYEPEPFDDPPRFLSGCVGPYGGRLLPVCCPDAATLTFGTPI